MSADQAIIDWLVARLSHISTANGYNTDPDVGSEERPVNAEDVAGPQITVYDTSDETETPARGKRSAIMSAECEVAVPATLSTARQTIRAALADIRHAIGRKEATDCGGLPFNRLDLTGQSIDRHEDGVDTVAGRVTIDIKFNETFGVSP